MLKICAYLKSPCADNYFLLQAPNNVIAYEIVGENEASKYFYINPSTGDITLLQSVAEYQGTLRVKITFY